MSGTSPKDVARPDPLHAGATRRARPGPGPGEDSPVSEAGELLRLQRLVGNEVVAGLIADARRRIPFPDRQPDLAVQRHSLTVDDLNEEVLEGHPGVAVQRWVDVKEQDLEPDEFRDLSKKAARGITELKRILASMGNEKDPKIVRHIGKMYKEPGMMPEPGVMVPVDDVDWLHRRGAAQPDVGAEQNLYFFLRQTGEKLWDVRNKTSAGGYIQGALDVRYPEAFRTDESAKGFLVHEGLHAVQHEEKVMQGAGREKFYLEFAAYWAQSLVPGGGFDIRDPLAKATKIATFICDSGLYPDAKAWYTGESPANQAKILAELAKKPLAVSGVEWWHTNIHIRRILSGKFPEDAKLAEWNKLSWSQQRKVKADRALRDLVMAGAGFGTDLYKKVEGR